MVFCSKCGQEISETDAFCLRCGEPQRPANPGIGEAANLAASHDQKGDEYFESGQFPQALEEFEQAVKLNPNDSTYYAKRASALQAMGRHHEALIAYDQAIAIDPSDSEFHSQKSNFLLVAGRVTEAINEINKAIELDSSVPIYHAIKCHALYSVGNCDEAEKEIETAIHMAPDEFGLLLDKAATLATCRKPEAAVATMNELLGEIGSEAMRGSIELALRESYMKEPARETLERFLDEAKRIEAEVAKELPLWQRVDFCSFLFDLAFRPSPVDSGQMIAQAQSRLLSMLPKELKNRVSMDGMSELFEKASGSDAKDMTDEEQQLLWAIRNSWYERYSRLENTLMNLDKFSKVPSDRKEKDSLYNQVRQVLIEAVARDTPYSEFKIRVSRIEEENQVTEEDLGIVPASAREAHLIELYYPLEGDTEAQTSAKAELFHAELGIEFMILPVGLASEYGSSEIHRLAMEKAPKHKWLVNVADKISGDVDKDWNIKVAIFLGLVFDSSREEVEAEIEKAKQELQAGVKPES